jgi:hypothetical protein
LEEGALREVNASAFVAITTHARHFTKANIISQASD